MTPFQKRGRTSILLTPSLFKSSTGGSVSFTTHLIMTKGPGVGSEDERVPSPPVWIPGQDRRPPLPYYGRYLLDVLHVDPLV